MKLPDKQLDNYKTEKNSYALEMTDEEMGLFNQEHSKFLEEKLGTRAYACMISFERTSAGMPIIERQVIGLDRPISFYKTIDCLKGLNLTLLEISSAISQPLKLITPTDNPVIKQDDPKTKKP